MANPSTRITLIANDQASPVIRRVGMELTGLGRTAQSIGSMSSLTGFGPGLMALANPVTALTAGFVALQASALRVDDTLRRTEKSFTVIYGSANIAVARMKEIRDEADRLGVSYIDLAEQTKKFDAAIAQSTLRGQGQKILSAFGGYGAVLGLDSQGMSAVYRAITQMVSKGKVSAEELRLQLAEQLPGAVQLFAEALGVSEQQLDKMLEKGEVGLNTLLKVADLLEKKFGGDLSRVTDNLAQNMERLGNSWNDLLRFLSGTDTANWAVKGLTQTVREFLGVMSQFALMRMALEGEVKVSPAFLGLTPQKSTELLEYLNTSGGIQARIDYLKEVRGGTFVTASRAEELDARIAALEKQLREVEADEAAKDVGAAGSMEARWLDPRDKGMSEAAARSPQFQEWYWEWVERKRKEAEEEAKRRAEQMRNALQQINADLARFADTGDGSATRMASLNKQLEDHTQKLGAAHPRVKEFADVVAYANEHLGYTPDQVARATRAVEEQSDALQDRADAIRESTRADGTLDQNKLALITAQKAAEREYKQERLKGISEEDAAAKRDLAMQVAKANAMQQALAVVESFYSDLAGMYTNDETLQRRLLDKQVENYRAAGVAEVDLARWKARRELEIATDAMSGISRGLISVSETTGNAARNMEQFTTGAFDTIGNSWSLTMDGMTFDAKRTVNDIINSFWRLSVVNPLVSSFSGGLSDFLSGLGSSGGTGGSASGAWGDYADRVVGVAGTRAGGGPVLSGKTYLVGENGPELFTADRSGAVLPNDVFRSAGAAKTSVEVHIHESPNTRAEVRQTPTANGVRLDVVIKDVVAQDIAKGGKIDQAIAGRGFSRTSRMAGRG
ncbi:tape measure protein [Nitratidesulfovibrio sp. 1201_IL3209]|uniref:tape measure protein n=1 Tax=Nitratidesulfovibrio sp. 1201_IL3209 TaxID=3084053 RepID=UPI002FD8CF4C